jgi:hypothetical protein
LGLIVSRQRFEIVQSVQEVQSVQVVEKAGSRI